MSNLPPSKKVGFKDKVFNFSYATSLMDQLKGLAGVKDLGELDGMLFDFGQKMKASITPHGILFPLDVLFLNEYGYVVQTTVLTPSFRFNFESAEEVQYVIEVPAGFIDQHEIVIGSKFNLD